MVNVEVDLSTWAKWEYFCCCTTERRLIAISQPHNSTSRNNLDLFNPWDHFGGEYEVLMLNCVWWSHNMDRCNTATVGIGMWTGETQNCVSILVLTKGQISGWFSDFANLRVLLVFRNLSNESYIEVKIVFQYNCTLRPRGDVILTLAIYSCCTMLGTVVLYWMQIYISFVFTTCLDNQLATKWANIHCQFEWQPAAFRRQLHLWLVVAAEDCSLGTVWLHYMLHKYALCSE